ncbi:uncharacterized protein OCT59_020776 [Rhizophagus irregularis]|uniref:Uncharacterized protein n=2 Tax=Rhizophagus irregularis TaxID=588596 RepID=U9SJ41_RHIID|nr:hypothetical protein GLOIN_2v1772656 [Rhizophagus irregularis DAOM 181602=DAOM 197198]EXX51732.1 hypothetical protein RirG_259160 [Rhizophagus irregularis DAOM 197198w]UZO02292.1 hypothetical protein OCT59_020776 [Rhizophagus irregularis]POG73227.1 hypothetical protein GLOIN_2v1772656 [Rhizophagus irregularis DAOM 181602=DAOM 197198]CAG8638900.1 9804_t:CDS:1 [Rhizophagus irregularis]GBC26631.1 interferon alpha-inducible protein 27-like protein 2 [Rhizophagus irregularis DAOM 181602=DAOM 197|eukprot:XP_025180093.1 hypothetical protein GLOIN_2v1772656 [Rhizophagus irregularis DAOM 181602=DAOM 197198]
MTGLSDIFDVDKCKGVIIDSLKKDKFIAQAQQQDFAKNFFSEHKTALLTGGGTLAGFLAGPAIVGGIVYAIGFGGTGITAGSTAAWMMSLHHGTVAAGSLVAILQSVGAAGLGTGGIIVSSVGSSLFTGLFAGALLKTLESKEALAKLENFVSNPGIVIFNPLLTNNGALNSFCRGWFDSARKITNTKRFEFQVVEKCIYGSNSLRSYLKSTYEADHVSVEGSS